YNPSPPRALRQAQERGSRDTSWCGFWIPDFAGMTAKGTMLIFARDAFEGRVADVEAAGLAAPETRIGAAAPHQIGMRAGLDDAAMIEHDQPVHARDRRQAMRDRDHRAALHQR